MSRASKFAIAYGVLILLGSSIPGESFPESQLWTMDKLIHMAEYTIFAVFIMQAVRGKLSHLGYALAITIAIGICYGGLDELYQSLIPGRDSSLYDWYADAGGAVLGGIIAVGWAQLNAD